MGIRALGSGEGSYMEWSVKPYSSSCWLEGFRSASCRSGFWSMLISELGRGRETLLVSVTELDKIMSVTGPASRPHWLHTALLIRALISISTCSYQTIVFSTLRSVNKTRTSGKHCFPGPCGPLCYFLGLALYDPGARNLVCPPSLHLSRARVLSVQYPLFSVVSCSLEPEQAWADIWLDLSHSSRMQASWGQGHILLTSVSLDFRAILVTS